jgi:hypothetical protein
LAVVLYSPNSISFILQLSLNSMRLSLLE